MDKEEVCFFLHLLEAEVKEVEEAVDEEARGEAAADEEAAYDSAKAEEEAEAKEEEEAVEHCVRAHDGNPLEFHWPSPELPGVPRSSPFDRDDWLS